MDKQYYYATDGQRNGPITVTALRELATNGELKRSARVWCQGMKDWQKAESVPKLFDELPPDLDSEVLADTPPPLPKEETRPESNPGDLWAKASLPRVNPAAAE